MQKYVAFVKEKVHPVMSEDANEILKSYYQAHRTSDMRDAARTTIRLLESLIRLSQAHARLMCHDKVLVCDAIVAVQLIEASMQTCALNGVSSTLHACFPKDPEADYLEQGKLSLFFISFCRTNHFKSIEFISLVYKRSI